MLNWINLQSKSHQSLNITITIICWETVISKIYFFVSLLFPLHVRRWRGSLPQWSTGESCKQESKDDVLLTPYIDTYSSLQCFDCPEIKNSLRNITRLKENKVNHWNFEASLIMIPHCHTAQLTSNPPQCRLMPFFYLGISDFIPLQQ